MGSSRSAVSCRPSPFGAPSTYYERVAQRQGPTSFETVEYATLEWVDWFNHRRLEPIGTIPPAEAEQQYYAAADTIDMAA